MFKRFVNIISKKNTSIINLKKKNSFVAIILKSNHSLARFKISKHQEKFRYDGNTYFISPEGSYIDKKNNICAFYVEGASTPLNHEYIETENVTEMVKDLQGNTSPYTYRKIKSLNFDSKIADMLLNRGLADVFTRNSLNLPSVITIILLIGCLAVGIITMGAQFS